MGEGRVCIARVGTVVAGKRGQGRDGLGGLGGTMGVSEKLDAPGGPREAEFRRIYDAEVAYVVRSLRRLGVPDADVEDLAHDVFVVVHRRWAELDRERPIRPWLFGVALRTASRALDRHFRHREVAVAPDALERASPSAFGGGEDARDLVLRALARLELDQRTVCILHDLDGLAAPEIAAVLEIPTGTVYSRLRSARARLAQVVTELGGAAPAAALQAKGKAK